MTMIIAKEHVVDLNGITLLSPFLSLECGSWRKTIAGITTNDGSKILIAQTTNIPFRSIFVVVIN